MPAARRSFLFVGWTGSGRQYVIRMTLQGDAMPFLLPSTVRAMFLRGAPEPPPERLAAGPNQALWVTDNSSFDSPRMATHTSGLVLSVDRSWISVRRFRNSRTLRSRDHEKVAPRGRVRRRGAARPCTELG